MTGDSPQPAAGAVRIHFSCDGPLSAAEIQALSGLLVGKLPVAPQEIEIDPDGRGWIEYHEADDLTLDDLTTAVLWLRRQARIADVTWQTVVDI